MLLQPKKTKFVKYQPRRLGPDFRYGEISFGEYALVTTEPGRITARQLEVLRRTLARGMGRQGKVWFKAFPHLGQTDKPKEARMGKGKGPHDYWATDLPGGTVVLEFTGVSSSVAWTLLKKLSYKLSVTTKGRERELPIN